MKRRMYIASPVEEYLAASHLGLFKLQTHVRTTKLVCL